MSRLTDEQYETLPLLPFNIRNFRAYALVTRDRRHKVFIDPNGGLKRDLHYPIAASWFKVGSGYPDGTHTYDINGKDGVYDGNDIMMIDLTNVSHE